MKISVLGCGRWGSFLGWYLDKIGHEVTLWGRENSRSYLQLVQSHANEYVTLTAGISLTSSLEQAMNCDCMIISVPGQSMSELMPQLAGFHKPVVLCMKGIEATTGRRLSEIAAETIDEQNIAVWVGPGHIQCFTANIPNCMLIDSKNSKLSKKLIDEFKSSLIRFYQGDDMLGSEIGAAAKNVIGLAAGMLDGLNLTTLKGALMARGAREVSRLVEAMGGNPLSAYGLCHLGDYETTLFSPYSHNRSFGEAYVKGETFSKLAEGVMTTEGLLLLAKKYCVELPITNAVHKIIVCGKKPLTELKQLLERQNKKEFYN